MNDPDRLRAICQNANDSWINDVCGVFDNLAGTKFSPILKKFRSAKDEATQYVLEALLAAALMNRFGEVAVEYEPAAVDEQGEGVCTECKTPDFRIKGHPWTVDLEAKTVINVVNEETKSRLRTRLRKELGSYEPAHDVVLEISFLFQKQHIDAGLHALRAAVENQRLCEWLKYPQDMDEPLLAFYILKTTDRKSGVEVICESDQVIDAAEGHLKPIPIKPRRDKLKQNLDQSVCKFYFCPSENQHNIVFVYADVGFWLDRWIVSDALYGQEGFEMIDRGPNRPGIGASYRRADGGLFSEGRYPRITGIIIAGAMPDPKTLRLDRPAIFYPNPVNLNKINELPCIIPGVTIVVLQEWKNACFPPENEYPREDLDANEPGWQNVE